MRTDPGAPIGQLQPISIQMGSSPAGLLFPYLPCVYPEVGVQRGWVCALGLGHLLDLDTVEWGWGTGKTHPNFADLLVCLVQGITEWFVEARIGGQGSWGQIPPQLSLCSSAGSSALLLCK